MTISKPNLMESLNLLCFTWDNGISVELHNLKDSGKAEIWARHTNGHTSTLFDVSELNLLAPRSRDDYCRRLVELSPGLKDFDWLDAFRYIVPMALQARRVGEPVIELGISDKEIKRPQWDAYPFLVKGMTNLIFGDRGSLKSKFILFLALVMMLPLEDNDVGIKAPNKSLKVLKLDFENTQDADDYEWHRLLRGLDIEGTIQLKYRACRRTLADDVESIATHADNMQADVLIVDSLGPAAGGDLNASEPALKINAAFRQLNRTIIASAHTAKNAIGKRSVFGNIFYENLARNIWEVTKEEDEDSESPLQHIALKQTKSPPFAPHHKTMAFEFEFDDQEEKTFVRRYEPSKMEAVISRLSLNTKILDLLKGGSAMPKFIAKELGETDNAVRVALYRLKKAERVIQLDDKSYGLLSKESTR